MFLLKKKWHVPGRILAPVLLILLSLGVVVACGVQSAASTSSTSTAVPAQQGSIPTINIQAMEFSYKLPATVQAGLVDLHFTNNGGLEHQAVILRLNTGVTYDQFHQMLLKQGEAALTLGTLVGGPNVVGPGQSEDVVVNLSAGHYTMACFVPDQHNIPHYMYGMVQSFTVIGSSDPAPRIQADATILLRNFRLSLFAWSLIQFHMNSI